MGFATLTLPVPEPGQAAGRAQFEGFSVLGPRGFERLLKTGFCLGPPVIAGKQELAFEPDDLGTKVILTGFLNHMLGLVDNIQAGVNLAIAEMQLRQ